ncbi:hypothetical protein [Tardiphaga alba]|uniref:hypothetical protein n=1 Tax=Tardiphaga alba TaxID=340268 RepID=UPI001BACC0AE|nr:hypothetical protein [Tardiphaga alba]
MPEHDISQNSISQDPVSQDNWSAKGTFQSWRISTFAGALLAFYFIPTWTIFAFRIMVSPIQGFYERPNISLALFLSDYLQLSSFGTVRYAWLLALGKLTVVAFFAVFLVFITRPRIRQAGGCDEPLAMALAIGGVISFASMIMASKVGEILAMRLHITELLLILGVAVVMVVEPPLRRVGAGQVLDPGQPSSAANDAVAAQKVA